MHLRAAVAEAMKDLRLSDIVVRSELGVVKGVAETFWFGFKDNFVARNRND